METAKVVKPVTLAARKLLNFGLRSCGAVIVAAGSARRMNGLDKITEKLGDKTLIEHTVAAFEACDAVREIVLVVRQDQILPITTLCGAFPKVKAVVAGGEDRSESVNKGILALSKNIDLVAVHDGARPLVTWELIDRVIRAGNTYGAAAPAVGVKDTVKVVAGGVVKSTPDRSTLQAVQTPQVFHKPLLQAALKKARMEKLPITDDCSAVEAMGMSVKIVAGEERNFKVTTPMDLAIARMLVEEGL